jgi:HEAT repeat protein
MLTKEQIKMLARASVMYGSFGDEQAVTPWDASVREHALASLGGPDDEALITSALDALRDDDRNLRVAALRLARYHLGDERVVAAVVDATRDPARRVRRIAVQLCSMLTNRPGVPERLREMVDDRDETTKISGAALGALAGNVAAGLPGSGLRSVSDLLGSDAFRERVLLMLLQQRADDSVRELLQEVVRTGTKGEAVAATRALCGMRIVNLAHFLPEDRKRIQATLDPVDLSWVSTRGFVNASLYWMPA